MDWNTFCENLKEVLELRLYEEIKYTFDDKRLVIEYHFEEDKLIKFTYTKRKFNNDYKGIQEENELNISNEKYYEIPILIRNDNFPIGIRYERMIGNKYDDRENNLRYEINKPSKEFLLKIVGLKMKLSYIVMPIRRTFIFGDEYKFKNGIAEQDIFELLKIVYRNFITLQIFSLNSHTKAEFANFANAFIFDMNYNMDIGIRQAYDIENIYERRRTNRFRRESIRTITAPKKIYKKELVEQYNMASISEEPFIKYLCYYHILEHFYEEVYKEELVKTVKERLTLPSFSIKKESEIIKLIDVIKEKIKYDRESFDGDELEALGLVIKKYIRIEEIKEEIEKINPELVEYYNSKTVKFSNGIPVNFKDTDNIYKNIAKRIYFTRNALVHYKSNNFSDNKRGIYRPFNDREELLKEIPLIRILAERVIIIDADII